MFILKFYKLAVIHRIFKNIVFNSNSAFTATINRYFY